jgi:T4 superinfection immunity protein
MSIWHITVLACLVAIYCTPAIIASARGHRNSGAIWALNILLGWSFIGWVAAFVWALTTPQQPQIIYVNGTIPPTTAPAVPEGSPLTADYVRRSGGN